MIADFYVQIHRIYVRCHCHHIWSFEFIIAKCI